MEVLPMNFLKRSYFSPIILTLGIVAAGLGFSTLVVKTLENFDEQGLFLKKHALPASIKQQFKNFFKAHELDASCFTTNEKELEKHLTQLGFQRTATGSNSLVMRCPQQLGNFVVKAPGRFHEVTRTVVDKPLENISRAQGADRINSYTAQAGVKDVKAVDEYLFHIPAAPKELSDYNYLVIEPYLDLDQKKSFDDFSLQQFKETVDIIHAIKYSDTHSDNIVIDKQGVVYFLDTSERDYLAAYKNLPSALYFSDSDEEVSEQVIIKRASKHHAVEPVVIKVPSGPSAEEQIAQVLKDAVDPAQKQAGQEAYEKIEVILNGLMPLAQEKLDASKRAYLQEKVDAVVKEVETLIEPFKKDVVLDAAYSQAQSLQQTIAAKFAQSYAQAA